MNTPKNAPFHLRVAKVSDASALAEIYRYYVDRTQITFEYNAPDASEFASRISHKLEKYPYIVAEEDGRVVGYAYASELRERDAYRWDAELSVYVQIDRHARGIGERLYTALIELLRLQNFTTVYGCITDPNKPSTSLHEKMGFRYAGRFTATGYKNGEWLDVVWYEKRISDREVPLPVIPFPELNPYAVEKILRTNESN